HRRRQEEDSEHRQERADEERERGGERCVPRVHNVVLVDVELRREVRLDRILLGELLRHHLRGAAREPLSLIQPDELLELAIWVASELLSLLVDQGPLAVTLARDRNVLAEGHRNRPTDNGGRAGKQDRREAVRRASDSDHDGGGRNDAVVRAEHSGTKPVESLCQAIDLVWFFSLGFVAAGVPHGADCTRCDAAHVNGGARHVGPFHQADTEPVGTVLGSYAAVPSAYAREEGAD